MHEKSSDFGGGFDPETSAGPFVPGSWAVERRIWLPAVCLLLVASLHLVRVHAYGQTAWKGGGFGMFSTVDSRNARFVRAYLVTEAGRLPVEVPDSLGKRQTELRAAPSQQKLDQLAADMAALTWVHEPSRWREIVHQVSDREDGDIDRDVLYPAEPPVASRIAPPTGERWAVRGVKGRAAQRGSAGQLAPQGVRLEFWRYHYDRSAHRLRARHEMTAERPCTIAPQEETTP